MEDLITAKIIEIIRASTAADYLDDPGIFTGRMIPSEYQHLVNTLMIYRVSPREAGDIRPLTFTVAVRQQSEDLAETVAALIYSAINRKEYAVTGGRVYFQATIQPALHEDDTCWQVPVDIYARNNL